MINNNRYIRVNHLIESSIDKMGEFIDMLGNSIDKLGEIIDNPGDFVDMLGNYFAVSRLYTTSYKVSYYYIQFKTINYY